MPHDNALDNELDSMLDNARHAAAPRIHPGLTMLTISMCVSALTVALYDKLVRQPSTPRLAVVDVARLYAEAERLATHRVLERRAGASVGAEIAGEIGGEITGGSAEFAGGARTALEFGPALEQVLHTVSAECRCAIVAMAAVYGNDATVPDFTAEVSRRLSAQAGSVSQAPTRSTP